MQFDEWQADVDVDRSDLPPDASDNRGEPTRCRSSLPRVLQDLLLDATNYGMGGAMKAENCGFVPLHGLAALGAGGLTVSVFVWLLFLTPHPELPVPVFETINAYADTSTVAGGLVRLLQTGIALLAATHIALVVWMLKGLSAFKKSGQYSEFWKSHAGIQWMIRPLVLAMFINVVFILGMVFVPGLWSIREWMFPLALIGFALVGADAISIWTSHLSELYGNNVDSSGSGLAGMFPAFTFAMVAVGFSASAAMSHVKVTAGIGFVGAVLLIIFALFIATSHFVTQFPAMIRDGVKPAASGTLWIAIPISTVLGIAVFRLMMGAQHLWGVQVGNLIPAVTLLIFFAAQLFFYFLGRAVMKRNNGWRFLVEKSPQAASFSLICPEVGFFVLSMFLVFRALMPLGILDTTTQWFLLVPLAALQISTIILFVRLMRSALPGCPIKPAVR